VKQENKQNELQENMQIVDKNIRNVATKMKANCEENEKNLDNFQAELTPIMKDLNATLLKIIRKLINIAGIKSTQKDIQGDLDNNTFNSLT